jgi:formate/nitrite transporter FocA (FNT family)
MSEVADACHATVDEGTSRLHRSLPSLLATGTVGGLDVSLGVFAMFIVIADTQDQLLGSLAFIIGFLALSLARSELFTENFLVPVTAVVAKNAPWWSLLRLWAGTLGTNLIGGWVAMGLVIAGFPRLEPTALEIGRRSIDLGINGHSFASAVLGGGAITLMTWMQHATDNLLGKLVAASSIAFVLAAAPLGHSILASIEIFAALHSGAPFGYLDWLGVLGWACLGNLVGGIGLVTVLRLVQVGADVIVEEQQRAPDEPREPVSE